MMPHEICVLQPEEADAFRPDRHRAIPEREFKVGPFPDCQIHRHVSAREARRLTGFENFAAFRRAVEGPLGRGAMRRIRALPAEWLDGRRIAIRGYAWQKVQRPGAPATLQLMRRSV